MSQKKFIAFVESLSTPDNKALIEAIVNGYKAMFEFYQEDFRGRVKADTLESKVAKYVAILQRKAEQMGEEKSIDDLDSIVGYYKKGDEESAIKIFERLPIMLKNDEASKSLKELLYA